MSNIYTKEDILDHRLEQLFKFGISTRTINALKRHICSRYNHESGNITVREMLNLIPCEDLEKVRNLGEKSRKNLISIFNEYGIEEYGIVIAKRAPIEKEDKYFYLNAEMEILEALLLWGHLYHKTIDEVYAFFTNCSTEELYEELHSICEEYGLTYLRACYEKNSISRENILLALSVRLSILSYENKIDK